MKANRKMMFLVVNAFLGWHVFAAGTVSGVKARQRYPWNGKVDIDCTLTGEAGKSYGLKVSARDKVGGTNLTVTAVSVEGGTATGNPVSVTSGVYRLVWDADKDLPNGFRGEKVSISVTVTDQSKKYMIVDLQSGAITYQANEPEGGWTATPYKTTKMAFQRIEAETYDQVINGKYTRKVTVTKPYYMAIYPLTEGQISTIKGTVSSSTTTETFYPSPFYWNTYYESAGKVLRGDGGGTENSWPVTGHGCSSSSVVGRLRAKTGNAKFDMPTLGQMSLACKYISWNSEGCLALDFYQADLGNGSVVDPVGPQYLHYDDGSYSSHANTAFHTLVKSGGARSKISYNSKAPTRFCLYEAD